MTDQPENRRDFREFLVPTLGIEPRTY